MLNTKETAFDKFAKEYDAWFDQYPLVFQVELQALKKHLPDKITNSLEIGIGTGRFAMELGITDGIDPSANMLSLASARGICVKQGIAESLPYPNHSFDYTFFITSLCFIKNYQQALNEAKRVLRPNGKIVIGAIDPHSLLGKSYEDQKQENIFLKEACICPIAKIIFLLEKEGFNKIKTSQTLFASSLEAIQINEPIKEGYGQGGFVVISADAEA